MLRKKLAAAKKDVLVAMVNMVQQRRLKGSKGTWRDFLNLRDQKFADSTLIDPRKRSDQVLVSFLETFTKPAHIKLLERVLQDHFNRKAISKLNKNSAARDLKSSKLVRLTSRHPEYESSYSFSSYDEDWVMTSMGNMSKSNKMLAIDCQMVESPDEPNTDLLKVCVVDENLEVKLNKLVNLNKPLLSLDAILIGHRLHCHLNALKLAHARVIDTSLIFKRANGKRPSLRRLCKDELGQEKGARHDCLIMRDDSGENDLSNELLLHGMTVRVFEEELRAIFLEGSAVVLKLNGKKKGKKNRFFFYSASAIFIDQHEAQDAFRSIRGEEGVDINGLPQKSISMVRDDDSPPVVLDSSSKKRQIESVEPSKENSSSLDQLGHDIREKGAGHDCPDNALAAMEDDQVIKDDFGENDFSKQLLLRGMQECVPEEELRAILSEDSAVVLKLNDKKKRKKCYSANAVFKDQHEAQEAFGSIEGEEGVDTNGLSQKRISVRLNNGSTAHIYVRKMVRDDDSSPVPDSSSRKRQIEEVEQPSSEESSYKLQKNSDDCPLELGKRDSKASKNFFKMLRRL
ncbi:hypothetical protein MKW98_026625 [Papaver atlanticum]|uniref:Uncharacterized protein n=1 Tax=Papaver atlanticum TaxID=357466 RepID=A0AAD4RZM8_9MAGN|nr:hypothetical protein MKW98_026625 [Papaver atlanticum]